MATAHASISNPWATTVDWTALRGADVHARYGEEALASLAITRSSALIWRSRRWMLMAGGALAGLAVGGAMSDLLFGSFAVIAGTALGAAIPSMIASAREADVRRAVRDCVAAALKLTADPDSDMPSAARRANDLLPNFDRGKYFASYMGAFDDIPFEICRAALEEEQTRISVVNGRTETRTEWVTVFDGVVLSFALRRKLEAPIRLRRKEFLDGLFGGSDRITYVHPDFNDRFAVSCADPMVATYIIHPVMVETLIALDQEFAGHDLIADFADQQVVLTLSGYRPFDHGEIDPASDIAALDACLADWKRLRGLMLHLSEPA